MAFIRKGYDPNEGRFSVYGFYLFDEPPQLSDVVKILEWGGNRNIRAGEIRIEKSGQPNRLIKTWSKAMDPQHIIADGSFLAKGKGLGMGKLARIIVKEREE